MPSPTPSFADLLASLSRPEAFPAPLRPASVRLVQTHISAVFVSERAVFKVKKPVDFGFLDFTTLEKRRHFCEEEVRLNRRLAPRLYRGVVPVVLRDGKAVFGPTGEGVGEEEEVVEWAVWMDPLPEERLLSNLLRQGKVDASDMERVADAIAAFHAAADAGPEVVSQGGLAAVIQNTEENILQVGPAVGRTLDADTHALLARYTRTFREVNEHLFRRREAEGRVRDGHGDLHSQHVCLTDPVMVFDCIEFTPRFRFADVLCDAAFLAMDLDRQGRSDLSSAFMGRYLARTGQEGPEVAALESFYRCYRAVVRGKVEGFRALDPLVPAAEAEAAADSARGYFRLATGYARTLPRPTLFVLCGLMGSGKSSLVRGLSPLLELQVVSSDLTRKGMAGVEPTRDCAAPYGEGIYTEDATGRTYQALMGRTEEELAAGRSVALDASFIDPARRAEAFALARRLGARPLLLYLEAPEALLRERLEKRVRKASVSDGRAGILPAQMGRFVPPGEIPPGEILVIDAAAEIPVKVDAVYRRALSTT